MILLQYRRIALIATMALTALLALAGMLVLLPRVLATDSVYTWEWWRLPWRAEAEYSISGGCGYDDPACPTHQGTYRRYSLDLQLNRGSSWDPNNGVPVHSIGEGVVVESTWAAGAGNYVIIKTYDPNRNPPWVYAFYCHLRDDTAVAKDTHVEQGQIIAISGMTEAPAGVHLHLRLSTKMGEGTPEDPNLPVKPEPMSGYTNFWHWDAGLGDYAGNPGPFESNNVGPGDTLYSAGVEWDGFSFPGTLDAMREAFDRNGLNVDGQQMGWTMVGSTYDWSGNHQGDSGSQGAHTWGSNWVQDFIGPDHGHGTPWGIIVLKYGTSVAYWVHGAIWERYQAEGGPPGWLGSPLTDEQQPCPTYDCDRIQPFENGWIWVTDSGSVLVGRRHDVTTLSEVLFGPAPITLSDTMGHYMWVLSEVRNLGDHDESVSASLQIAGKPAGCSQDVQLILPGQNPFTLLAWWGKWLLWRVRYECHAPAHGGIYPLQVTLCVDHVAHGGSDDPNTANDCQQRTKSLLIH